MALARLLNGRTAQDTIRKADASWGKFARPATFPVNTKVLTSGGSVLARQQARPATFPGRMVC
jgi:hypothetical protein